MSASAAVRAFESAAIAANSWRQVHERGPSAALQGRSDAGAAEAVWLRQFDADPAAFQDRRQHRSWRGAHQSEGRPAKPEYRGLPLDLMEDLLASSPAWLQAQRVTHAPKAQVSGRPLIPLHRGHVGLLCTSSLLNGRFGQGRDLHLSFWESVKVVDKVEEEGASPGAMVIRERERFSQRLTLLYGDGRFALLSEKAVGKEGEDAKRAPQDRDADVCETNP